ncbi:hypothetical protein D9M68_396720 [compost metagenome]
MVAVTEQAGEFLSRRADNLRTMGSRAFRLSGTGPQCLERINIIAGQQRLEGFQGGIALDGLGHFEFFQFLVVQAHKSRVADVLGGLFVLVDENFQVTQVTTNALVAWFGEQVGDLGRAGLAVAVDPAIALLEHHQRPGDIEVDQAVRLIVQVKTFGGDIRSDQQA